MTNIRERLGQTNVDNIRRLHDMLEHGQIPARDQNFARDLLNGFRRWNNLSEKQWAWVKTLIDRALEKQSQNFIKTAETLHIAGFSAVEAMLYEAAKVLQFPAIRCETDIGEKIILRPAKNSRGVNVTFNGERRGRITSEHYPANLAVESLVKTLRDMANNPLETARRYAKRTSSCCFCGLILVNESSVYHGYGPICADNFGLPWGDIPLKGMAADLAREFEK